MKFSPGLAQGCFELLEMARSHRFPFAEITYNFSRIGVMQSHSVLDAAQTLNWLSADDQGIATLTASGERLIAKEAYEDRIKQALLDYIDIIRPAWVQSATFGRANVIQFAGGDIAQVFHEAGLATGISPSVVEFWDELAARARGQKSARLNSIGREGERLTIAYEEKRTGETPRWVSIDNNADGYDILSVVDSENRALLSIEVKTSRLGAAGSFFISANEWDRAVSAENHVFHFWDISSEVPLLAILRVEEIEEHTPANRAMGEWKSVEIPFKPFKERFAEQPLV